MEKWLDEGRAVLRFERIDGTHNTKNHINYNISDCIIKIKQRNPKIEKYDELFENKGTTENILYNICKIYSKLNKLSPISLIYPHQI